MFTAHCPLPNANCQLATANRLLPTANCQLPTAHCSMLMPQHRRAWEPPDPPDPPFPSQVWHLPAVSPLHSTPHHSTPTTPLLSLSLPVRHSCPPLAQRSSPFLQSHAHSPPALASPSHHSSMISQNAPTSSSQNWTPSADSGDVNHKHCMALVSPA